MNNCEHDIDIYTSMTRLSCVKCGLDANVIEIYKLTKELETTKKLLDEAKEVIKFYANEKHWLYPGNDYHNFSIAKSDTDRVTRSNKKDTVSCGGRRARRFLTNLSKEGVGDVSNQIVITFDHCDQAERYFKRFNGINGANKIEHGNKELETTKKLLDEAKMDLKYATDLLILSEKLISGKMSEFEFAKNTARLLSAKLSKEGAK